MSQQSKAPTLGDVARLSGVSQSTVSRVINGIPGVRPEVVQKVQSAVSQLRYTPNRAARSLVTSRTDTLALIVPESTSQFFQDPFIAAVVDAAVSAVEDTRYTLQMIVVGTPAIDKTRSYLQRGSVDGLLVVSHHDPVWRSLSSLAERLPTVLVGRPLHSAPPGVSIIDVDNISGGREATEHLISLGRTRIGHISGPFDMSAGVDRARGWRAALEEAGLRADLLEPADYTDRGARVAMRQLLEREPALDGVFVSSDLMAVAALDILQELGRDVPGDVAMIGFDGTDLTLSTTPRLSTVDQRPRELGSAMIDVAIRRVEGRADADGLHAMPTTLVVRESSSV